MAENTQFSITLPNQAIEMIEDLIETGLYGANRAEVSRSLILGRLEQELSPKVGDGLIF